MRWRFLTDHCLPIRRSSTPSQARCCSPTVVLHSLAETRRRCPPAPAASTPKTHCRVLYRRPPAHPSHPPTHLPTPSHPPSQPLRGTHPPTHCSPAFSLSSTSRALANLLPLLLPLASCQLSNRIPNACYPSPLQCPACVRQQGTPSPTRVFQISKLPQKRQPLYICLACFLPVGPYSMVSCA